MLQDIQLNHTVNKLDTKNNRKILGSYWKFKSTLQVRTMKYELIYDNWRTLINTYIFFFNKKEI